LLCWGKCLSVNAPLEGNFGVSRTQLPWLINIFTDKYSMKKITKRAIELTPLRNELWCKDIEW
ncbi:MAG: hypothetical protein JSV51_05205, partial [Candidatus Bathyarchaeota archaeon]